LHWPDEEYLPCVPTIIRKQLIRNEDGEEDASAREGEQDSRAGEQLSGRLVLCHG